MISMLKRENRYGHAAHGNLLAGLGFESSGFLHVGNKVQSYPLLLDDELDIVGISLFRGGVHVEREMWEQVVARFL